MNITRLDYDYITGTIERQVEDYIVAFSKHAEKEKLNQLKEDNKIADCSEAVLICNPNFKGVISELLSMGYNIHAVFSNAVEPSKVYHIVDKELAERVKSNINKHNKGEDYVF